MPSYHPRPELLMDYATGALPEPLALLIATHGALCGACSREISDLEVLGGALLETLDSAPLAPEALDRALARLDLPGGREAAIPVPPRGPCDGRLPRPLHAYVTGGLEHLAWRTRGNIADLDLLAGYPGFRTQLLRIRAGTAVPQHTHEGSEYTLLLAGGFSDAGSHYRRGDVAEADPGVDHRPLADLGEDCLCLAVTDAPLRLTGPLGRYLNFLLRL